MPDISATVSVQPHHGHSNAARSLRLLFPVARQLRFDALWITCDPENMSSTRSAELLPGRVCGDCRCPRELHYPSERSQTKMSISDRSLAFGNVKGRSQRARRREAPNPASFSRNWTWDKGERLSLAAAWSLKKHEFRFRAGRAYFKRTARRQRVRGTALRTKVAKSLA